MSNKRKITPREQRRRQLQSDGDAEREAKEQIAAALKKGEGEEVEVEVQVMDIWDALQLPLQPTPVKWSLAMAEGTDDRGNVECYGIVTFVSSDTAMRVWFAEDGFDNLINFLQSAKQQVREKGRNRRIPDLAVARSKLIVPGQP